MGRSSLDVSAPPCPISLPLCPPPFPSPSLSSPLPPCCLLTSMIRAVLTGRSSPYLSAIMSRMTRCLSNSTRDARWDLPLPPDEPADSNSSSALRGMGRGGGRVNSRGRMGHRGRAQSGWGGN